MARAMVIDYQARPNACAHDLQYLFGPSFLVAPLTSDGGATRNIWLPAGSTWYHFLDRRNTHRQRQRPSPTRCASRRRAVGTPGASRRSPRLCPPGHGDDPRDHHWLQRREHRQRDR
ncbi:hypothetical protein [Streptomyces sp. NPDC057877]|uniref:hypothetical protein n=1 Tax=Streptomyces sp. NPDC057877 TaxID=3346269 RepID=UPI0036991AA0